MIGNTMTRRRRQRKLLQSRRVVPAAAVRAAGLVGLGIVLTFLLLGAPAVIPAGRAATTEQIVTDRNSGLAIHGFDPVAYFIDGMAVPGKSAFEYPFAGAVWRFRNEGNQKAFIADPEVYVPRFGGYDPVAVARGVAVPGDPRLWLMDGGKLYLFYTPEAKDAFARDPNPIVEAAEKRWPQVRLSLSP